MAKSSGRIQLNSRKKYPVKKRINLMYKQRKTRDIVFTLAVFCVYLVCLFFFQKFAVSGQLKKADDAESYFAEKQRELQEIQAKNNEYAAVRTEYSHYGNSYLTSDEEVAQDSVTMLNIIDTRIQYNGDIQNINLSGNVAEIKLCVVDAHLIPEIIKSLEESEYVNYVTAKTANTVDQDKNKVVVDEDGSVLNPQYVDATITIYFRSPDEVATAISMGEEAVDQYLDASPTGPATGDNAYVPEIREQETAPAAETVVATETEASGETSSGNAASGTSGSNDTKSKASNKSSSSSSSKSKSSSGSTNQQALAQQQAAQQQQAAAYAAAQAQAQANAAAANTQNVYIDTPGGFGSGSISIQGGSPLG
ncbi:hypothetical protein [Oribacterium sp. WCC10]|uniref:hypothetical protein n=1 Tax=Oribacterium sp. WCC10 TaxID=1855343 RepID=UPI0008E24BBE|nr:hypothetical protein [Oribacterium sp. WCC10]SFG29955.1 hypothetical protein SAMN05216356_10542 [Oribacterium sp. WCC10]